MSIIGKKNRQFHNEFRRRLPELKQFIHLYWHRVAKSARTGFKSKRTIIFPTLWKKISVYTIRGVFTKIQINTSISSNCQSLEFIVPEYIFIFHTKPFFSASNTEKNCLDRPFCFRFITITLFHELSIKCQFPFYRTKQKKSMQS